MTCKSNVYTPKLLHSYTPFNLRKLNDLISNAIDNNEETLHEKNTPIMIISRKKKLYLWRYSISSEENREKQNARVHEISPYDNE